MSIKFCFRLLALMFLPLLAFADEMVDEKQPELIVNNRILASVNGKNISVVDVMKKMDVYMVRVYPEQARSNVARQQFFSQHWKQMLTQMIDNELIMADAARLEIKVTDAEIRETIHERFGPNVMATLDGFGITLDEAWQMIYSEMAVQRMTWYRVHSKAMHRTGPQNIKESYQQYVIKTPPSEKWKYQVLSIRAKTEQLGSIYAQKAYALIRNEPLPFEELAKKLQEESQDDSGMAVNVSQEYDVESKDLSESHKAVLCSLEPNSYSQPISQVSRRDNTTVHRIFYLKDHIKTPLPSFDSMVEKLQDELIQAEVSKEFPLYLSKLRKQFNFDQSTLESIPSDFEPFVIK